MLLTLFLVILGQGKSFAAVQQVGLDFYGHPLKFSAEFPDFSNHLPISREEIHTHLNLFEPENDNELLEDLNAYSEQFQMDDMAFLQMSKKLASRVYATAYQQNLFLYHILRLKNYDVIMGYSQSGSTVYGQLGFKVFNAISVESGTITYTDLSFSQQKNTQIEEIFEKSSVNGRAILINENRPPLLSAETRKFKLYFEFEQYPYYFNGKLNESLVKYYQDLPDIMFSDLYLNYQVSEGVRSSLLKELSSILAELPEEKKIAFLLKFTQEAIPYKDDMISQGKEKFSFPEETLANPYGDCEDKSILFAYLSKELLNKTSLALVYFQQHHLNVAIESSNKEQFNFSFRNKHYLVCEPSGYGFQPGDNTYDVSKANIVNW